MAGIDPAVVRDVVVVVPGIMGSTLIDAHDREVWSLNKRTLAGALATLGGSTDKLALPKGIGDGPAPDGVRPGQLMPALHSIPGVWSPIDGYAELLTFLRGSRFHLVERTPDQPDVIPNLVTFPYDWRLSVRYNGHLLAEAALGALTEWRKQPGMESAQLILVCHSLGGLVARWFLEREKGAQDTRHLITIGTPHRGSVKPLDFLVNGIEKGIGPLKFRLTTLARSLPSLYQLLPTYACLTTADGTRLPLGHPDAPTLDHLDPTMLADAARLHEQLNGPTTPYAFHKVIGTRQPTLTTAWVGSAGLQAEESIDGLFQGGDGTVPRMAAEPLAGRGTEVHEVSGKHGVLHGTVSALDLLEGILTRREIIYQGPDDDAFGVGMEEVWTPQERPQLTVTDQHDRRLQVVVLDESRELCAEPVDVRPDGTADLEPLLAGGYFAVVASPVPGGPGPIEHPFVVVDPTAELPPEPPRP